VLPTKSIADTNFRRKTGIFDPNFAVFSEPHQKSRRQVLNNFDNERVVRETWPDDNNVGSLDDNNLCALGMLWAT
jgi:hypothetical protein